MAITSIKKVYLAVGAFLLAYVLTPAFALAQAVNLQNATGTAIDDANNGLLNRINELVNNIIPFLVAIGVFFIILGLILYIIARDEEKTGKAIKIFVSGIIATVLILAIWWLIGIFAASFEAQTGGGLNPNALPNTDLITP